MSVTRDEILAQLRALARECSQKGAGYAQEGVVLREAERRLQPDDVRQEQSILDCWYDLFRTGELEWGYNLDNPGHPFFHVRQ